MKIFNSLKNILKRALKITGLKPQSDEYWVAKMFGSALESDTGIIVDSQKALTSSAIWNAVNIISGAVGYLPLIVYRRDGDSKQRAIDNHVYYLLHTRPNPYMDSLTFKETLQAHVLLAGNGYAEIERNGRGEPVALWPLLPSRVTPDIIDNKLIYKYDEQDGRVIIFSSYDILHIKGLGAKGLQGYSVIEYAANNLGLGFAVEKYGAKFFKQGLSPSGILETEGPLTEAVYKQTKEQLAKGEGLDNAHRTLVLQHGMKWRQIAISPTAAQFINSRKFTIEDVARWFDLPPHMLKDLSRSTYSNIEHQGLAFVIWTLMKWLRRWELEVTYKLLDPDNKSGLYAEFLVDALLRGDTLSRYQAYKLGRDGGWLSVNKILAMENMNPIGPEGDTYLEPLNMKPMGSS